MCAASRTLRKDFGFAAHVPSLATTLLFRGKSDEDADAWINAITQCAEQPPAGQAVIAAEPPQDASSLEFAVQVHQYLQRIESTTDILAELLNATVDLKHPDNPTAESSILYRLHALHAGLSGFETSVVLALRSSSLGSTAALPLPASRSDMASPARERAGTGKAAPPVPGRGSRRVLVSNPPASPASPPPSASGSSSDIRSPESPRPSDAEKLALDRMLSSVDETAQGAATHSPSLEPMYDFLLTLNHRRVVALPPIELPAEIFAPPPASSSPPAEKGNLFARGAPSEARASLTSEEVEKALSKGPPRRPAPTVSKGGSSRTNSPLPGANIPPSASAPALAAEIPSPRSGSPLPKPSAVPVAGAPPPLTNSGSQRSLLNRSQPLPATTSLPLPITPAKPLAAKPPAT